MKKKILIITLILWMIPFASYAMEENDYRIDVENHFREVGNEYELIDLHFVLYTMDAAFTEKENIRNEWTNQIDDQIASELHDFFSNDELTGSDYNQQVLDYLEQNFEIEEPDDGGFFAAIGNFFKSIFNFFAGLF
ncbi:MULTISPECIES: hypothetical protein [Allobacillus]|uniref:Uncharacterized protein n=1 Tax=Allobacillus halotolerans TaxID=570278 RepID=A0ABS6GMB1_9BACI|nr:MULTISPECIES: hypothetical protein [Allobacillus]MBU6079779.1 hypothetical protein [Allobacillus halotolerans]TSJ67974.1 hypothetical protein FPQ10_05335 [Allobacillus sp. SKP2-8]